MLHRRIFLSWLGPAAIGAGIIGVASDVWAQRPAQPIARPPGGRPGRPLVRGRFGSNGGVASGTLPGVYTIVEVDMRAATLQLRDEDGRTGTVHVNPDMFDLESLKPGDEVDVDFLVQGPDSTKLEAGSIWKVQR